MLNDENARGNKILIISGSSNNSIYNLFQETIHSIINIFFTEYINNDTDIDKYKKLFEKIKLK
jgi:hypothetical protein